MKVATPLTPSQEAERADRLREFDTCRACHRPIAPRGGQLWMFGPWDDCARFHAACVAAMLWDQGRPMDAIIERLG